MPGARGTETIAGTPDRPSIPDWVHLASPLGMSTAERTPWGFTHETWIVTSPGGLTTVVQRRRDRSDPSRPRAGAVRAAVRAVGLPVPEPAPAALGGRHPVVVLPYVCGRPAATLLDNEPDAELAGSICGQLAATLSRINPAGLGIGRAWSSADRLRAAGGRWIRQCAKALGEGSVQEIGRLLERGATELDGVVPVFAHGDLAPVNILVQDGRAAAVLDLDRARVAHPSFDAAWFLWVVTYHHPLVAAAAWRGYARGAGLPGPIPAACGWLQPLQLLELAASAHDPAERLRWTARLEALLGTRAAG